MAARRNSKAPKVNMAALRSFVDAARNLSEAEWDAIGLLLDTDTAPAKQENSKAKPAARKSTRKPKADAPTETPFVTGCTFTYVKKSGAESQHRIVSEDNEVVQARSIASGQTRPWKRTTLAAMLQTGNIVL